MKEQIAAQSLHDARHRRAGSMVRRARVGRRARCPPRLGRRERPARCGRRPRVEHARRRRGVSRARRSSWEASWHAPEAADGLLVAGGGAPLAVCLHRARAADLGGLEFACAIPGTVGRRRLDERRRLRRRHRRRAGSGSRGRRRRGALAHADRARPHATDRRGCGTGQVVAVGRVRARAAVRRRRSRRWSPRCRRERKAAQPTNKRTFGSVFKNPEHELTAGRMLEACGLRGFAIGGAQISPKHANFIENAGEARTVDAVALIAEARRTGA